jgi:phosphoglycerate kinase
LEWFFFKIIIIKKKKGPAGVFEFLPFRNGSIGILDSIIYATKNNDAISIIGGGETGSFIVSENKQKLVSHISTGGGASLELLEGNDLPGIISLSLIE